MFICLGVAGLIWRFIKQNWTRITVLGIVVFLLSVTAYKRNSIWNDPVAFWKDCASKSTKKPRPNYNLANALYKQDKIDEAIKYYTLTLQLDPNHVFAHNNLALALMDKGEIDQAIVHCKEAIRLDPEFADAHYNIAIAFHNQNNLDKAILHYNQALRINPRLSKAHNGLAQVFCQQDRIDKAISHWFEALRLEPDWPEVLNDLAWFLVTYENPEYFDADEGLRLAKRACELTKYENPIMLDTLAAAYAAAGQFSQAVKTAERAGEWAVSSGEEQLARDIQSRLELYKTGQQYHNLPAKSRPKIKE
jgi:Tfp pilus assembly protein PilF